MPSLPRLISLALIPPVPSAVVFTVLVFFYEHGSPLHRVVVWLVCAFCAGGAQMIYVALLRRRKLVAEYDVRERHKRTGPYLLSAGTSLAGLLLLLHLDASVFVWSLMWCFSINTLLLAGINTGWKISAHMMGLSGPLTALFPLFGWNLLYLLPVLALLGWARVRDGAHSPAQVIAGALAGIIFTAAQLFLVFSYGISVVPSL